MWLCVAGHVDNSIHPIHNEQLHGVLFDDDCITHHLTRQIYPSELTAPASSLRQVADGGNFSEDMLTIAVKICAEPCDNIKVTDLFLSLSTAAWFCSMPFYADVGYGSSELGFTMLHFFLPELVIKDFFSPFFVKVTA